MDQPQDSLCFHFDGDSGMLMVSIVLQHPQDSPSCNTSFSGTGIVGLWTTKGRINATGRTLLVGVGVNLPNVTLSPAAVATLCGQVIAPAGNMKFQV